MTLFEISEKYNIPPEIIKEYEHRFLCGKYENTAGPHEYSDEDIENLSIIITLRDIGFSAEETDRYMRTKLCLLCEKRNSLLCQIHSMEDKLQRLDYLKYKLTGL